MIYGELGVFPVEMYCIEKVLNFWAFLVNARNSSKICVILYKHMLNLLNTNEYNFNWLEFVKGQLTKLDLVSFWENQNVNIKIESFKSKVKRNLRQSYVEKWQQEVFNSRKCTNYRMFKRELKFEKYLVLLPTNLRINFTKFRLSNHKLPIELGRHLDIERSERTCHLCEIISDEYHAIFECPLFHEQRLKTIKKELHFRANADQYMEIFSNYKDIVALNKLAKFCKVIIKFYK